jgi:hypothetical protein
MRSISEPSDGAEMFEQSAADVPTHSALRESRNAATSPFPVTTGWTTAESLRLGQPLGGK